MANESDCRRELSRWFGSAVTADVEVMRECLQICSNYNISGETLFFQWEAFSYNNVAATPSAGKSRSIQGLTLEGAKSLRAHVAREATKANEKRNATMRGRGGSQPISSARMRLGGGTPHRGVPSQSGLPAISDRVVLPASFSAKFSGPSTEEIARRTYRYMYEKVSTRSEVLDDRIDELSELIRDKYDVEELGDPSSVTEDIVTVVGRLCLDPEADAVTLSKLSPTTLILESSRMGGSGERVPLKFEPNFSIRGEQDFNAGKSLFPGEILALRGRNGGGGWFSVKEILPIPLVYPPLEVPAISLSLSVASGPYTSDQNLDFEPFRTIVEEARNSRPSVLLFLGPFIDASHSSVKASKLPMSPLALFQQAFLNPIISLIQHNPGTLVLLVPHVRDLLNSHTVFPQGIGEGGFGNLPPAIKVLPNPCIFSLNGIRFGVSTVDVLYHLKNQQYIQRRQQPSPNGTVPAPQDVMANLCRHILEQRSFYPIFPVPLELSMDVNLDVSHSEHLKLGTPAPDVLVLPSILRQFSKNVEGTVVVNPSVFGKSRIMAQVDIAAGGNSKLCDSVKVILKRLS